MYRIALTLIGFLSLALGFIGMFLPVLPTVPLILLASACFARSSPRFHAWLLNNRQFGPIIRQWEETRTISLRAKILSIVLLNLSIGLSMILIGRSKPALYLVMVLVSAGVTLYLARIPTSKE